MTNKQIFAAALEAYLFARDTLNNQPSGNSYEQSELLSDAYGNAYDRLMTTQAADISDHRAKMEVLWEDPHSMPRADHLQAVMQDLIALTDKELSRTYNPATWLHDFERFGGGWVERAGEIVLMVPNGIQDQIACDAISDLMFSLEACNGREAVANAIKAKAEPLAA